MLGERKVPTGRSGEVLGRDCAYGIQGRAGQPVGLQPLEMRSQRSQQPSPRTVRSWPQERLGLLPREMRSHWSQAEEQYGLCREETLGVCGRSKGTSREVRVST